MYYCKIICLVLVSVFCGLGLFGYLIRCRFYLIVQPARCFYLLASFPRKAG